MTCLATSAVQLSKRTLSSGELVMLRGGATHLPLRVLGGVENCPLDNDLDINSGGQLRLAMALPQPLEAGALKDVS